MARNYALTPKQLLFARAVATGKSYTAAALFAGFSPSGFALHTNANKLAQRPNIKAEIERLTHERIEVRQLTTDEWHTEWRYQYSRVRDGDAANAIRLLETGARVLGLYDPQTPANPQATALIEALRIGIEAGRNMEAKKLREAQPSPIHGVYQVLEGKDDNGDKTG